MPRASWLRLLPSICLLAASPACSDTVVTTTGIASVVISPENLALGPGDTARLSALLLDRSGDAVNGEHVSWSSEHPGVAEVGNDGLVKGVAGGVTTITATARGHQGEASVEVRDPPRIVLGTNQIELERTPTAADTLLRLTIRNGGAGELDEITASVGFDSGEDGGEGRDWLTANVEPGETPEQAQLVLRVSSDRLPPGTHRAEVEIRARAAQSTPANLSVVLRVVEDPPALRISSTSVGFVWEEGGLAPPPRTLAVENVGGGRLEGLTVRVDEESTGPPGWLHAELDGDVAPTSLEVAVTPHGLDRGTYRGTIQISAPGASANVAVRLVVGAAPPQIDLLPTQVAFSATEGSLSSASPHTIQITNAGGGRLDSLSTAISYGSGPGGWLRADLVSSTAPTELILSLVPTTLSPGQYEARVRVTSPVASNSPLSMRVTLEVMATPTDEGGGGGEDEGGEEDDGTEDDEDDGTGGDEDDEESEGDEDAAGLAVVEHISYRTVGGPDGDRHLRIDVALIDGDSRPLSDATVDLALSNASADREWVFTGTTSEDGVVTFELSNHPEGCYSSRVTSIRADGFEWDGATPTNGYCRG